jgi:K(+)-stimulated pyrophosphate-energized sodium pump
MMLPGAITIISPILVGFLIGPEALGGFLAGATVSGVLLGIFQNNAGGAWDNAKKSFEKGVSINGVMYYKKSEPHKASVTGDTVGDPFKDTSGPSMNILIKLMSIVSLVIAPSLAQIYGTGVGDHLMGDAIEVGTSQEGTITNDAIISASQNQTYSAFISALQEDGFYNELTTKISVVNNRIVIDGKTLDADVSAKYIPLLKGETNMEIEFK